MLSYAYYITFTHTLPGDLLAVLPWQINPGKVHKIAKNLPKQAASPKRQRAACTTSQLYNQRILRQ
jgi:hypothetical protein